MNEGRTFLSWSGRAYGPHLSILFLLLLEESVRTKLPQGVQFSGPAVLALLCGIPCSWIATTILLGHNIVPTGWLSSFGSWIWKSLVEMKSALSQPAAQSHLRSTIALYIVVLGACGIFFMICFVNMPLLIFLADLVLLTASLAAHGSYGKFRAHAQVETFYSDHPEIRNKYSPQQFNTKVQTMLKEDPWGGADALLEKMQLLVDRMEQGKKKDLLMDDTPPAVARIQQLRVDIDRLDQRISNLQEVIARSSKAGQNTTLQERELGKLKADRAALKTELNQLLKDNPNLAH